MIITAKTGLAWISLVALLCVIRCSNKAPLDTSLDQVPTALSLDINEANRLSRLPLACTQTVYPNKLGQTLGSADDIGEPHELHPAFYGCFDWHSSVHGHWSMVKLLSLFPGIETSDSLRYILQENITAEKILAEVNYLNKKTNYSYERTYGWAWLLKLSQALHEWDDPIAAKLNTNLQPLSDLIADRYIEFLPKLHYPVRVGTHTNTAFGMSFAYDYASRVKHQGLKAAIEKAARRFYLEDRECPMAWEPSGTDFLSPCLQELDIMRKILSRDEFFTWLKNFMPELLYKNYTLKPGIVTDRTDGHLVHLDGLNFSRAWVFYGLAKQYTGFSHLIPVANQHIEHSLPELVGDHYEGGHWLGSFAIYALSQK